MLRLLDIAPFVFAIVCSLDSILAEVPTSGPRARTPWDQSRLVGSPEPPLPYVLQPAFDVEFMGPVSLNRVPHTSQYLVSEQQGKIYALESSLAQPIKTLCVDFNATLPPTAKALAEEQIQLFSLTYHPNFASNRWVYVCYVTHGGAREAQTHISRFELPESQPLQLAVQSEFSILKCGGGGHNGCTLAFGNDGYLYISLGDIEVPNPPDPRDTGQDISDLYASILRIDVDRTSSGLNYSIPDDNPFVNVSGARAEVFAYGLRNPFRMSFDPPTGDLWVGDVGWEAWEMVYRIKSGGNYGWAIKEGPGDVKPQTPGPSPILPADIALNHAEAASVTGGMVYRGQKYPDLVGTYIFGDWITRKYWAAQFDEQRVIDYREIALGAIKPICFESEPNGELLIMDYSEANQPSRIYRLVPNPAVAGSAQDFPRNLSQTGLFADTAAAIPAAGVLPYTVNAPMWADGARAEYLVAIPGDGQAQFHSTPQTMFAWFKTSVVLPLGSVLVKTYSFGEAPNIRRIETQIALKDEQGDWQYYSYRWNDGGTDATLVGSSGEMATYEIPLANKWFPDSDKVGQTASQSHATPALEKLDWQFGSRTSCRICHTAWTGETLAFIEPQLRTPHGRPDSWQALHSSGVIGSQDAQGSSRTLPPSFMPDPQDATQPLDARARAYLHTNCGHCHLNGGNASTTMDISFSKLLSETRIVDQPPMRGDLGLTGANIVTPGRPARSILFTRIAKSGAGRMPHVGSQRTDPLGVRLMHDWIAQLPSSPELRDAIDTLCAPQQSRVNEEQRRAAAHELLTDYNGAIELASALAEQRVPQSLVREIVTLAQGREPAIRDLIEPYAAPDQRVQRLGPAFDPAQILGLDGRIDMGKKLFAEGVGTCSSCHRLEGVGKDLGPDLSQLADIRRTQAALLKAIMQPSLEIEEKYRALSVLDDSGYVWVGRVLKRDEMQIVLQDASGNSLAIAKESIEVEKLATVSLMPEQLLAPLTAQQAADLIAYVNSL